MIPFLPPFPQSIEESEAPPAIVNPHGYGIFELSWSRPPAEANNGPFVMANSNPGPSSQPALDAGETDIHGYGIFEPAWSRPVAAVVRNEPFVMADPNLRAPPEPSPNVVSH